MTLIPRDQKWLTLNRRMFIPATIICAVFFTAAVTALVWAWTVGAL